MVRPGVPRLEGLIYAALLGRAPWSDFLSALGETLPNGKGLLFFHDGRSNDGAFALHTGIDPADAAAYAGYYARINPWMPAAMRRPVGKAMAAEANLPRAELMASEYYNDFLRRADVATGVGITIRREAGCHFMLSVNGALCGDETITGLGRIMEGLMPHLRDAFDHYKEGRVGSDALFTGAGLEAALNIGILQVGVGLKVLKANEAAARILETSGAIWTDRAGRLASVLPAVLTHAEGVLRDWFRGDETRTAQSFLLPMEGRRLPLRVTVLSPLGTDADRYFQGQRCTLLMEDPNRDTRRSVAEFASLHGLSPAESRLVAGLADGESLDDVASRTGITASTARTQLKQVFAKSGLRRQADLVREIHALAGSVIG